MFVGTYNRKVLRGGRVLIPMEWLSAIGRPTSVYVVPNPEAGELCIVPRSEAGLPETAVLSKIDSRGAIRLSASVLGQIGAGDSVALRGAIRMIKVCAAKR